MTGRERPAVLTALLARWRLLLIATLAGLLLGLVWGISDRPRYEATATLVVEQPFGGEPDAAALERYAALGESEEVASLAAAVLGGDVAGGDLLADVSVVPSGTGGTLEVRAASELPDFAPATADAFAQALTDAAADRANAAYRNASERLDERLAEIEPDSAEADAVAERRADLEAARAIDPLSPGAEASLPDSPSEDRPATLTSLAGAALGLLAGLAAALLGWRRSSRAASPGEDEPEPGLPPEREAAPEQEFEPEPEPEPSHAEVLGVPLLARLADPGEAIALGDGGPLVASAAVRAFEQIADVLAIDDLDGPRTLGVLGLGNAVAGVVTVGIALAAADLGLRVIVVDADLADPSLHELLGVEPSPGLSDYLAGDAGPRDVLRTLPVGAAGGELRPLVCVPAGSEERGEGIGGARFAGLVARLPKAYDLVVFAGPPLLGEPPNAPDPDARALIGIVDDFVLVADAAAELPEALAEGLDSAPLGRVAGVVEAPSG